MYHDMSVNNAKNGKFQNFTNWHCTIKFTGRPLPFTYST